MTLYVPEGYQERVDRWLKRRRRTRASLVYFGVGWAWLWLGLVLVQLEFGVLRVGHLGLEVYFWLGLVVVTLLWLQRIYVEWS